MTIQDAYIVAIGRTAVAKRRGAFIHTRPDDMLAHVLKAVTDQVPGLDKKEIGDVVVGCAMPEAEQGMNVARLGVLLAGLPHHVPAVTINRFCSSGVNALAMAADRIRLGDTDVAIAAGTESMTAMTQMMGNKVAANPAFFSKDENRAIAYGMGLTAEKVANQWKVSRDEQDAFAVNSHKKAMEAIAKGYFKDEIVPYTLRHHLPDFAQKETKIIEKIFAEDEGPRPDSSMERLAKLKPVFHIKGSVTPGNASQMSDGAGAILLMSKAAVERYGVKPLARFVSFSVAGVPPEIMGIGPIEAIPKALKTAGLKLSDMNHIELNEAFAAQAIAVMRELNIDPSLVNPQGGAIALGHPLGATGAIRVATIVNAMRRNRHKYGMVTMCIGTGMGAACIIENLQ